MQSVCAQWLLQEGEHGLYLLGCVGSHCFGGGLGLELDWLAFEPDVNQGFFPGAIEVIALAGGWAGAQGAGAETWNNEQLLLC